MIPIHFAQPLWLMAGSFTCLAVVVFIRISIHRRQRALKHFAAPHLLPALTRNVCHKSRLLKNILFVLALACLFAALARPQYGEQWIEVRQKGIDILIGFDVSKSMLARDLTPDRMTRAKLAVRDFVRRLDGDRIGLLPFAGTSFLICPLTTDYEAFTTSLDALDVHIIPRGGTNIGAVIRDAEQILQNEANHKILVLLTDGEDLSKDALSAAATARKNKLIIFTIGVGSTQGELIPVADLEERRFIQDESGNFVTSKLDEQTLRQIADHTGGLYVPLGNMGQGLETVYQKIVQLVPAEEHNQRKRKIPIERFHWPLGAACLFLIADFLITGRKNRWALRLPFIKTAGRRNKPLSVLMLAVCIGALSHISAHASEGEQLYEKKHYDQAVEHYQQKLKNRPADPTINYNLGAAAYKNGDYTLAATSFEKALETDDIQLQAKSYYNRGNTLFNIGKQTEQTDPDHTITQWKQAIKSYKAAQALNPQDKQAIHNQRIVQKKLDVLQKKKQKQKKQNKEQKNKKNDPEKQQKKNKSPDKKRKDQHNDQKGSRENRADQQQSKAGANNGKPQNKTENSKDSPDKTTRKQDGKQQPQELKNKMSARDIARKKQGKMTMEEAKNLLNSLKGEQKELTFLPQQQPSTHKTTQDW